RPRGGAALRGGPPTAARPVPGARRSPADTSRLASQRPPGPSPAAVLPGAGGPVPTTTPGAVARAARGQLLRPVERGDAPRADQRRRPDRPGGEESTGGRAGE